MNYSVDWDGPGESDDMIEFPDGWFIQDRPEENTALLCCPHWNFGNQCVCLRPRAISTEDWTPIAAEIAQALQNKWDNEKERDDGRHN